MPGLDRIAGLLVPALCASCRAPAERRAALCPDCERALAAAGPLRGSPPPGVDDAVSVADHDGAARRLLAALKFGGGVALARDVGARMAEALPLGLAGHAVVPVPPSRMRLRRRGFDPASGLAEAVAERHGLELRACLRREGGGRQRGRDRAGRLGAPPRVRAVGEPPAEALLVDDVMTTGATLSACAGALRAAGARRVAALTFTRRL